MPARMAASRGRQSGRTRPARSVLPWVITGAAALAVVVLLTSGRGRGAPRHPDPRPDAQEAAAGVMPPSFFASLPRVRQAYQIAREIPDVLDGLYCYCECKEHLGHRSLLICYHSQHGAGCDVCIGEAEQAYELVRQGRSLAEVRSAIDLAFGR